MQFRPAPTGLSGDIRSEIGTTNINSNTWAPVSDCTLSGGVITFPLATAGSKAFIRLAREGDPGADRTVFVFELQLTGDPSSEIGLLSAYAEGGTHRVGIGTDRRITVYDYVTGQALMRSQTQVSTTGWTRVVLVSRDLYQGDYHNYLYVDGVQEDAAIGSIFGLGLGDNYTYGEWLAAGVSRGVNLLMRRVCWFTLDQSPVTTAMPDMLVAGGSSLPPTSEGTYAQWANGTTPSPNTWQDVDEFPGNDDTDRIAEADTQTLNHTFYYSAANPLPASAQPYAIQWSCVGRVLDTGKEFALALLRLGTTDAVSLALQPGTMYRGFGWIFGTRPDGTAWQRADFNPNTLQFGARTVAILDTGAAITCLPGPIIYYAVVNLPLARPASKARGSPTYMGLGVGVL